MGRYYKMMERNCYILSYSKKGSSSTNIKKWDVVRKLTKKLTTDDERAGRIPRKESHYPERGVQLLPRQDVTLYGTIPKMEQRVYSKCKECNWVFNPRDILSHRNCSRSSHSIHSTLLKKKVKSKSGSSNKKTSSSSHFESTLGSNNAVFKKPSTPPPVTTSSSSSMPQLKVSVTKIGLSKVSKSTTVLASSNSSTSTTSSDKSDSRVASSKVSSNLHHNPRSLSQIHHSSKSSSLAHSHQKGTSSGHHNSKSFSSLPSHSNPRSPSTVHHSPRLPSKSHHGNSHHSNSSSHHSSKSVASSRSSSVDVLSSSSSSHHHHSSSSSHSNKHRKSSSIKRSSSINSSSAISSSTSKNKIVAKDYDPDLHCGVIEGNRGPCTRSITCSNHRIQLRKLVPGRSKHIHQLIADRKAAKEKDVKQATAPYSYTSPNGEAKETSSQNTSYVPVAAKGATTTIESPVTTSYVPIMPHVNSHQTRPLPTSLLSVNKTNVTEHDQDFPKVLTNGYISHAKNIENTPDNIGTVPILIMPMSPISVISSVQFLKIGNNIISLESPQSATSPSLIKQPIVLPIQANHSNGIKMYKSHPKPLVLPNFGTRRAGGAILFANPRLEGHRNELLTVIDSRRKTVNNNRGISLLCHLNNPHRPNILKVKGGTKINCKRPANDKLITSDSKKLIPDVNGFILHADVSETADAPQSNNSIQEEIVLFNLK